MHPCAINSVFLSSNFHMLAAISFLTINFVHMCMRVFNRSIESRFLLSCHRCSLILFLSKYCRLVFYFLSNLEFLCSQISYRLRLFLSIKISRVFDSSNHRFLSIKLLGFFFITTLIEFCFFYRIIECVLFFSISTVFFFYQIIAAI